MNTTTMTTAAAAMIVALAGQAAAATNPERGSTLEGRVVTEPLADVFFPGRLDVSEGTGRIAVGRVGPGPATAYPARTVDATSGDVENVSFEPVPDPDSVAWDDAGRIGPAGSVLVGTIDGVFSVEAGGDPVLQIPASSVLDNPEDIAFDSQGRLIIASFSSNQLVRYDPFTQTYTELAAFPLGILQFALAADDTAYVVHPEGGIAVVPADGSGIDRIIGDGRYTGVEIVQRVDRAGVLPGIYTFDIETGDLLRVTVNGSGPGAVTEEVVLSDRFEGRTVQAGTVLPAAAEIALTNAGRLVYAITDSSELFTLYDPCVKADTNRNGVINGSDFFAWVVAFMRDDATADTNADGMIAIDDFMTWITGYSTCGQAPG